MKASQRTINAVRRHRQAIRRSARMGGSLARLVRVALRQAVAGIPERVGPADLLRVRGHVGGVVDRLRAVLPGLLRVMLLKAAEREHLLSAVQLTRASRRVQEDWRDYAKLLIPAPVLSVLEAIVGTAYRALTRLIDPQKASNVVLQWVAMGKDRKQIAKDLEQVFGGYEGAARRVARTEGARVAMETQLHVSEQIPELVVGYQLYTVLDDRVRPEHRKMHNAKFYRVPKAGQRGLDECPRPPIWNGQLAHNCRCALLPIIEIDGEEV